MKINKWIHIIIAFVILLIGIIFITAYSFVAGSRMYHKTCQASINAMNTTEAQEYCGWQDCESKSDKIYVSDVSFELYVLVFLLLMYILGVYRNSKLVLPIYFAGIIIFTVLMFFNFLLQHLFPHVEYVGWQDACRVVQEGASFFNLLLHGPIYSVLLVVTIIGITFIFGFLGPVISSFLLRKKIGNKFWMLHILLSIGFQVVIAIVGFPVWMMGIMFLLW